MEIRKRLNTEARTTTMCAAFVCDLSANLLLFYDRARLPPRVPLSGALLFVVIMMSSKPPQYAVLGVA